MSGEHKMDDAKNTEEVQELGIVTSDAVHGTSNRKQLWLVTIVVLVVVATLALAAGVYARQHRKTVAGPQNPTVTDNGQAAQTNYVSQNKATQANLETQLAAAKTPQEKAQIYVSLSSVASDQNNKKAAVDYAQSAVTVSPTLDSYVSLGAAAMDAGQYKIAAGAYAQAAALYKAAGGPTDDRYYQTYIDLQKEAESHL